MERQGGGGGVGVEWKLAPHYLQQLVHSLMIKCWRSICEEIVGVHALVCVCVCNVCTHIFVSVFVFEAKTTERESA